MATTPSPTRTSPESAIGSAAAVVDLFGMCRTARSLETSRPRTLAVMARPLSPKRTSTVVAVPTTCAFVTTVVEFWARKPVPVARPLRHLRDDRDDRGARPGRRSCGRRRSRRPRPSSPAAAPGRSRRGRRRRRSSSRNATTTISAPTTAERTGASQRRGGRSPGIAGTGRRRASKPEPWKPGPAAALCSRARMRSAAAETSCEPSSRRSTRVGAVDGSTGAGGAAQPLRRLGGARRALALTEPAHAVGGRRHVDRPLVGRRLRRQRALREGGLGRGLGRRGAARALRTLRAPSLELWLRLRRAPQSRIAHRSPEGRDGPVRSS